MLCTAHVACMQVALKQYMYTENMYMLYMYLCIYTYMYIRAGVEEFVEGVFVKVTCTHIYMTCTHTYIHGMHTPIHDMHTRIHDMHTHIPPYMLEIMNLCANLDTPHTYTCTQIYIYIYIHQCKY